MLRNIFIRFLLIFTLWVCFFMRHAPYACAGSLSAFSVFDEHIEEQNRAVLNARNKAARYAFEHTLETTGLSTNHKPTIFISYARPLKDNQYARDITRCIDGIVDHFRKAGMRPIYDNEINPGGHLGAFMERINTADFVAVLFTPQYKENAENQPTQPGNGVRLEVKSILNRFVTNTKPINESFYLPILIDGSYDSAVPDELRIANVVLYDFATPTSNYYTHFLTILSSRVDKNQNNDLKRKKTFYKLQRECLKPHGKLDSLVHYLEEATIYGIELDTKRIRNYIHAFCYPYRTQTLYYVFPVALFSYACLYYYTELFNLVSLVKLNVCFVAPSLPLSECTEISTCLGNIQYGRYVYRKEKKLYDIIISGSRLAHQHLVEMSDADNSVAQGYLSILYESGTPQFPEFKNEKRSLALATTSISCLKKIATGNVQDVKWILEKMSQKGIGNRIHENDLEKFLALLNAQTTDEEHYYATFEKEDQSLTSNSEKQEVLNLRASSLRFMDGLAHVFDPLFSFDFSFRNISRFDEYVEFLWHRTRVTLIKNSFSEYKLANHYITGRGVTKNTRRALYWLYSSADKGFMRAELQLAKIYHEGLHGVPKSMEEALYWYYSTAEKGDNSAQCTLGFFYEEGIGVPKNINSSAYWYERSSRNGNAVAEYRLAQLFESGRDGHPINLDRARSLYALSILHEIREPELSKAKKAFQSISAQR